MMGVESAYRPTSAKPLLRLAGLVASLACVAAAIYSSRIRQHDDQAWWLLGAAFVLAMLWQCGIALGEAPVTKRPVAPGWCRGILGGVLAVGGVALWVWAPLVLFRNWNANFDSAWLAWLAGAVLLSIGLELLWGRHERAATATRSLRLWPFLLVVGLLAVSAVYRLGNLASFPGEGHITQIEELQNGMFGQQYLDGVRGRWEYLTEVWASAAGIALGGPTLLAVRTALAVVSMAKTIPIFVWLSYTVGGLGAAVGTALLTCSSWDVIFSRIGQPTQILPAIVFALLAGPARRGRPAAYVWLGFVGGYLLFGYIAFRPLILFILLGGTVFSMCDRATRWPLRLLRPLIILAMIVSMGLPLFLSRLHGRIHIEYFDGLDRARGNYEYYNPNDGWQQTLHKGMNRTFKAAGLFFFHGDSNSTHDIGDRPLVDPVTATLMLFGVAYCLRHWRSGVFGLTVAAFAVSLAGTLVFTGNWDVARAATTMVYPYALAGYGAAAVGAVLEAAWPPQRGRKVAVALLAAAVPVALYLNTTFLFDFWSSPEVRQAMHHDLARLTSWLRQNVRPGERVVVISPEVPHVLMFNDGSWMRGGDIPGVATQDVGHALQALADDSKPTLLVVFAGSSTAALRDYFEWLIPGMHMQFEPDADNQGSDLAYAHLTASSPQLGARIAATRCLGVEGEYEILGSAGETLGHVTGAAPFIDFTTWSNEMDRSLEKLGPKVSQVRMRFRATIRISAAGRYVFIPESPGGQAQLLIDGQKNQLRQAVQLDAGVHTFEVESSFTAARVARMRLLWQGPESAGRAEMMPVYRLAEADADCLNRSGS